MAALKDILSPVWTLDKNGGGQIVEGIDAIRQAIDIIVSTTKGSDPLRPEFGCDANKFIDYPINIASPLISKALYDALTIWEPRIVVSKIKPTLIGNNNLSFNIGYILADSNFKDDLLIDVISGRIYVRGTVRRLILNGLIPPNASGYPYKIGLLLDGNQIFPLCPNEGFLDIDSLYDWVQSNWRDYGNWYLTPNAIIGSINSKYTGGSIVISLFNARVYAIPILPLSSSNQYSVRVIVDGTEYDSSGNLYTAEDILSFVQNNDTLGSLGSWSLQNTSGDFNKDFDSGFNKQNFSLVLETQSGSNISMSLIQGTTGDFNNDFSDDFNKLNVSLMWSI